MKGVHYFVILKIVEFRVGSCDMCNFFSKFWKVYCFL